MDLFARFAAVPMHLLPQWPTPIDFQQVWASSGQDKNTPWHYAAQEGHLFALKLLVEASKEGALSNTFDPTSKAISQVGSCSGYQTWPDHHLHNGGRGGAGRVQDVP